MSDRFVLKQFAGNATISGDAEEDKKKCTGIFGSCAAGTPTLTNDIKQVQSLQAYEDGWSAATMTNDKLPPANEMQGLQGLLCKAIKEIYSEGIPEWIDGETYYQNSFVQYNGIVYRNITGSYTSTAPDSDTTNWQLEFARLNAANVFTQNQSIKNTNIADNSVTPASNTLRSINFTANDDSSLGYIGVWELTNGQNRTDIFTRKNVGGTDYDCRISASVLSDGTPSTYAPTPASTSKDTNIATTKWISDLLLGGGDIDKGWTYLGNGLVLEWVHTNVSSLTSVTLPRAMDSSSYIVAAIPANYSGTTMFTDSIGTRGYTTTNFLASSSSGSSRTSSFIIVGKSTIATKP